MPLSPGGKGIGPPTLPTKRHVPGATGLPRSVTGSGQ